jgi:hypothetical protein
MNTTRTIANCLLACAALGAVACSDDDAMSKSTDRAESQTPPMGATALEAWLSSGAYKDWHCEEESHAARSPSPHGANRICSNSLIAEHATESGDWPEGAAAVKEIYAAAGDDEPIGYAVYLKTASASAEGANWYWYERIRDSTAADGLDEALCTGCHTAAGSDAAHTPSPGGRDQVYTPVP